MDSERCPLTENGVIRVVGHPKYPNSAGSPAAVAPFVAALRALPGHVFWKDDLSLIGSDLVKVDQIVTRGQVTDALSPGACRRQQGPVGDL